MKLIFTLVTVVVITIGSCTVKKNGVSDGDSEKLPTNSPEYTSTFLPRKAILVSNPNDTIPIDNLELVKGQDTLSMTELLANVELPKNCTKEDITGTATYKIVLNPDQTFGELKVLKSIDECFSPVTGQISKKLQGWKTTRGVGEEVHFIFYHQVIKQSMDN